MSYPDRFQLLVFLKNYFFETLWKSGKIYKIRRIGMKTVLSASTCSLISKVTQSGNQSGKTGNRSILRIDLFSETLFPVFRIWKQSCESANDCISANGLEPETSYYLYVSQIG